MAAIVRFHKDGDSMAISTDAHTEQEFMGAAAVTLAEKIQAGEFSDHGGDWLFQLERWLPQIVDICCKLRGYKAEVTERRVIIAGEWLPNDVVELFSRSKERERVREIVTQ